MNRYQKATISRKLNKRFSGVKIKWHGDDPTLVLPDDLENKQKEIIKFTELLGNSFGNIFEFYPERAIRS